MNTDTSHNMAEKIVVITGATSGIGFAAASELAAKGVFVIGVGRSVEKCKTAQNKIQLAHPDAKIIFEIADLSSQKQIKELGHQIRQKILSIGESKIDVLINNAGAVSSWYTATEDGYELQFAVNHLAPFLLTHQLLPLLKAANSARVITVSSRSHRNMRIHWKDVMFRRFYNTLIAYKQSKLANVMFTAEFNRRFSVTNIRAYAADPGLVKTDIGLKGTAGLVNLIWGLRSSGGATPEQGASTIIFLASEASIEGSEDIYWKNSRPILPSRYAQNVTEAKRLWELSERLCGIKFSN